jgi:hypothetical protein
MKKPKVSRYAARGVPAPVVVHRSLMPSRLRNRTSVAVSNQNSTVNSNPILSVVVFVVFVLPIVEAQSERLPPIFAPRTEPMMESAAQAEPKSPISRLTRERLRQVGLAKTAVLDGTKPSIVEGENQPASVVVMAPVVVQEGRPPELFIRRENEVEKFFRTGTFYENVGKKVTTKVWAKGDRGIMLSFSW